MAHLRFGSLLVLAVLIAACGGGDDEPSDATTPSGGDVPAAADFARFEDAERSLTLHVPPAVVEALDGEFSVTRTDTGWDLQPDGATFDEPVFFEIEADLDGSGLPVAVLEQSDGSLELPFQLVQIEDGRASFVVATTHFTQARINSMALGSKQLPIEDEVNIFDFPSLLIRYGDIGGASELLRDRINEAGGAPSSAVALPFTIDPDAVPSIIDLENHLSASPGASALSYIIDPTTGIAFASDSTANAPSDAGSDDNEGESGSDASGGGSSSDAETVYYALPTRVVELVDATDISDLIDFSIGPTGIHLRLDTSELPGAPAGGEVRVFITADTNDAVLESRVSTDPTVAAQLTVFGTPSFNTVDTEALTSDFATLEDNQAALFFPLTVKANVLTATVNGTDYPVSGLAVGYIARDANGENPIRGEAVADLPQVSTIIDEAGE